MNTSDIDQMLAEKGNLCVSIVVPTHRYSRDRIQDPKTVYKAVEKAKHLLQNSAWPKDAIQEVELKLEAIHKKIDFLRLQEGLAIFVSPNISKLFLLPFQVKEKVILGKNFEIRDLLYYAQFLKPYYLLAVSKKRIPLFRGEGRDLHEIRDNDFPQEYAEEFEYAHPSVDSSSSMSLKSFERDKSILQEIRQKDFMKHVDHAINKYLKNDMPLLIAGVEEALSNFEHVTHHLNQVVGKIQGEYAHDALHALSDLAWKKMNEYIRASQKNVLIKLQEDIGRRLAVDGIRDVWKSAKEGKGLTLIIEKDFQPTAYLDPTDDSKIYLTAPTGKYEIITDAADDVIEVVKEKGGDIVIVENGELERYDHIAMLLRYQ